MGAGVAAALACAAGCSRKTPRIPTRPAPGSSTKALGSTDAGEILDTEDGPISIDGMDPQQGPMTAHCVIVIFSDFQCPFCKDMADVLRRIRTESPKDVRLVFKHLPTPMHYHARTAAIAAQVVFLEAGSDAFWRYHDRAFAHQRDIDESVLNAWARDEGILAEAITKRWPEAEKRVSQDIALTERLGIHGTPHFYVNARTVAGAYPYEQVRDWVDQEI
jgi:protein-disulfide isomerase